MTSKIDEVISYAETFLGLPYIYGGNGPIAGFDCSGLICEVLKAFGVLHYKDDLSAQDLFRRLTRSYPNASPHFERGSILFFGTKPEAITHVALAVSNTSCIEAGGGGPNTTSIDVAIRMNAFVRRRPVRRDLVGSVMPLYAS